MRRLVAAIRAVHENEQGHVAAGMPALVGAIGAVVLGFGAAGDSDVAAIAGGVILGLGVMGGSISRHRNIDYEIYNRLEQLEKK